MDKSPEAFRTISEVADFLDTPAHVLRFWESRFPQIRPVKRAGGRRYYRPADVALLAGIKKLLHDEGMTIRGVQKILREQGIRHVASLASGDAGIAMDESDIEAVLSAEYGPRDRITDSEPQSSEALQSAQIISLETALTRQEAARDALSGQTELWPPAEMNSPSDDAGTGMWPDDPGDPFAPGLIEHDLAPQEPRAEDLFAFDEAPTAQIPEGDLIAEDNLADMPLIGPDASAPVFGAEVAAVPLPDSDGIGDGAGDVALDGSGDSPPTAAQQHPEESEPIQSATVASLLRRTSPEDVSDVQSQLIHLRDRLIDLRTRVSEAARRRAK